MTWPAKHSGRLGVICQFCLFALGTSSVTFFSHLNQFRPINDCRILSRQPVWIKHMNSIFIFFLFLFEKYIYIYSKSIKNYNLIHWFSVRVRITNSECPDWHHVLLSDPRSCLIFYIFFFYTNYQSTWSQTFRRFSAACLCSPTFRSTLCWATSARNVIDVLPVAAATFALKYWRPLSQQRHYTGSMRLGRGQDVTEPCIVLWS